MTPAEAFEWLTEQIDHLRSRRPGCPDQTCLVCKRDAEEDRRSAEALAALEAHIKK